MVFSDSIKGQSYLYCRAIAAIEGPKGEEERGRGLVGGQGANLGDEKLRLLPLFLSVRGAVGHVSETRAEKVI